MATVLPRPVARQAKMEPGVWRIGIVVILGMIMSVMDTTIVNIALDSLSRDLKTSLDSIQWVITGYLLSLAAVIPVTGWAAKRYGTRPLYLISLVLFTLGSVLCGLATSSLELVTFRVIQGIGGGMILPLGQMILVKKAGPKNMARVMSGIGVPVVLAPVFGPTIGGLLLDHAGWRWIFFVNVPIGIAAFIAALRLLPRDRPQGVGRLDVTGMVLVAGGLVGITYGLAETGTAGSVISGQVLAPLLAGLTLLAAFVVRGLRVEHPLLDLRLYRNPAFAAASLVTFCLGAALFGGMILLPLYYQNVRGNSAVVTGLLLAPQGIGAAISMWLSGRASERFGAGRTAFVGGLGTLAFTLPFTFLNAHTAYQLLAGTMVLRGFALGLAMMPSMSAAYRTLQHSQIIDATPQLAILQRVGGSIGTAIFAVVLQQHLLRAGLSKSAQARSYASTFVWVAIVTGVAVLPTLLLMRVERRVRLKPGDTRAAEPAEIAWEAL